MLIYLKPPSFLRLGRPIGPDATDARRIRRQAVGYSSYQAQRRDTWAQVAELDACGGADLGP